MSGAEHERVISQHRMQRGLLLRLAEVIFEQIVRIFLRNGILVPELEVILRRAAARVALTDREFSAPARNDMHAQSAAYAAVITGIPRFTVKKLAEQRAIPEDMVNGELHRLFRVLNAWRTESGYQDDEGRPVDLPLHGRRPSLKCLCLAYGADTTTGAIADALVNYGCAEWVGATNGLRRGSQLRYLQPIVAVQHHTSEAVGLLAQHSSDFFYSLQQSFSTTACPLPRFRQAYFNDIGIENIESANEFLKKEMETFNSRCAEGLKKFRTEDRANCVRLGAGSYSFIASPLLISDETS